MAVGSYVALSPSHLWSGASARGGAVTEHLERRCSEFGLRYLAGDIPTGHLSLILVILDIERRVKLGGAGYDGRGEQLSLYCMGNML
jgi:hypothetical protein